MNFRKPLSNKSLFYLGLSVKLFFSIFFASYFLKDLFIPFVDYFVASGFENPYERFLGQGPLAHFPYPAMMLFVMAIPKILFGWIAPNSLVFSMFLYRLPILVADLSIFFILKSWLKKKQRNALVWFYWLSPVLLYISYFHGQLDAIPTAFLFGCLYFLFKGRCIFSGLFLGAALATKTNMALVYPFFALYLISKNKSIKDLSLFFLASILVFFFSNVAYWGDPSFISMVFNNPEQNRLFNTYIKIDSLLVYPVPAALIFLFVRGALLKNYNRDIFVMFLGFSFSIILLFVAPMQGWYYWIIPFLSYFYIKSNGRSRVLFFSLQLCYLMYFALVKGSDYVSNLAILFCNDFVDYSFYADIKSMGMNPDLFINIVFTVLQALLLMNCFWIYKKGLESYSKHKITSSPFLIGIGGNSGVGKTTLSKALEGMFGQNNTAVLRGDDMHKWQRGHEKWSELTHLDPKANHLHKEIRYLKKLKNGSKIYRRNYNHDDGRFTSEKVLHPNNIVIFEGLHPFYLSAQRKLYDLKIYIKPSKDLMYHWKIIRDQAKRSYTKEKILESIKKRENDSKKFIDTQLDKADIVVEINADKDIVNLGDVSEQFEVFYTLKLSNDVYIEPLISEMEHIEGLQVSHQYNENEQQQVILKGINNHEQLSILIKKFVPGLEDLGVYDPKLPQGLFGAVTLLLSYYIFEKGDHARD